MIKINIDITFSIEMVKYTINIYLHPNTITHPPKKVSASHVSKNHVHEDTLYIGVLYKISE